MPSHKWCPARLRPVAARIEPEPADGDREAILAALAVPGDEDGGWSAAALLEGVEDAEPDP